MRRNGGFYFKCTLELAFGSIQTDIGELRSVEREELFSFSRNTFGSSVSSMSLIVCNKERVFFKSPLIVAISRYHSSEVIGLRLNPLVRKSARFYELCLFTFLLLCNKTVHVAVHLLPLLFNHGDHHITL